MSLVLTLLIFQVILTVSEAVDDNSTDIPPPLTCRTERREHIPYDMYRRDTCARCYFYMPPGAFAARFRYLEQIGLLLDTRDHKFYEADPDNVTIPVLESFSSEDFVNKWVSCCEAALRCCDEMLQAEKTFEEGEPYCPRTWDGWHCWPDTSGGSTAKAPCPEHIYFKSDPPSCTRFAEKKCLPNGTWYINEQNSEWTNYTNCGKLDEHRRHLYFHVATYAVSITFLIPALIIFSIYKQLQVHRITMHKNLFISLFLNGVMVIVFKCIVILGELDGSESYKTIIEQNGAGCKILLILTKYCRMTNYMWMFCEGFYLHKLIAAAFAEQKNLIMFYIIGWVFPVLPVSIYAILRKTLSDEKCWAYPAENFEWIMNFPNLLSLLVNLAFLCNIIRVLVTKLRATHANEPSQYRKAVRATLVLVPLFGLHFCLTIYRPQRGPCGIVEAYTFFNYAMDGLQGFLVSLIFCFLNGEVLYLLRRSYQRYRMHNNVRGRNQASILMNRMSTTQVSTVVESHTGNSIIHHRNTSAKNDAMKPKTAIASKDEEDNSEADAEQDCVS